MILLHQNLPQSKDVENSTYEQFCLHDRRHHRRRVTYLLAIFAETSPMIFIAGLTFFLMSILNPFDHI